MAPKNSFAKKNYQKELNTLAALQDGTATKSQLVEVQKDICQHLATPTGTLANYHGRFGAAALKSLQDNYNLYTNVEESVYDKTSVIFNKLTELLLNNDRISIPPLIFQQLINYISGKENAEDCTSDNIKYIVVDTPFLPGTSTKPISKI